MISNHAPSATRTALHILPFLSQNAQTALNRKKNSVNYMKTAPFCQSIRSSFAFNKLRVSCSFAKNSTVNDNDP